MKESARAEQMTEGIRIEEAIKTINSIDCECVRKTDSV